MGGTRLIRGATAAAVLGGATVAGAIGVGAAPPPAADTAAVCVNVPDGFGGFDDIGTTGNTDNIECLAYAGITSGVAGGGYAPSGAVTRAQMATFIARLLDTVTELDNGTTELQPLPESGPDAFTDDDGLEPHEANIDRLAAAGIAAGSGGDTFNPNQPVNRAQMATFINNANEFLTGSRLTSAEDFFVDDDGLQPHEANINGIAAAGVAQGVSADRYGPSSPVTRSQMASFLMRYLATLHADGAIDALPASEPVETGLVDGSITNVFGTCTWTDGVTSARPPATLVIDSTTIAANSTCSGGAELEIGHHLTVSFDDDAGTLTVDRFPSTASLGDIECEYLAEDVSLDRDGETRRYSGEVSAGFVSGPEVCPATFDTVVDVTFR